MILRFPTSVLMVALAVLIPISELCAAPDRAALLNAWEAYMRSQPSTAELTSLGDSRYRLVDTDLPYTGELVVTGALLRTNEAYIATAAQVSHIGIVDFELTALPAARARSSTYNLWASDRKSLYYAADTERWLTQGEYFASMSDAANVAIPYETSYRFGSKAVFWALLAIFGYLIYASLRHSRKARALLDDSQALNAAVRQNIEDGAKLQSEMRAAIERSQQLQQEGNATLQQILAVLEQRKP